LKSRLFLFFIYLLFQTPVFAQEKAVKLPLKTVLESIEKQHQVRFNYLDEVVEEKTVQAPSGALNLAEKINYLTKETQLDYNFIDSKSISIFLQSVVPIEAAIEKKDSIRTFFLNEIVVENYLTTGISKKIDGKFLIKPNSFGLLPGLTTPDVFQTMQQIPGILSVDETISNINVRGGTHDQNYFSWNGIRLYQTGHFFGMISAVNPLLAQEISLYKNGSSAFDGESVSSLVAITSKLDSIEKSKVKVETDLISVAVCANFRPSQKTSLILSGRRSFTDFLATPTYKNYIDRVFQNTTVSNNNSASYILNEKFYFYDFSADFQQKIGNNNELNLSFIGIKNNLQIDQITSETNSSETKKSNLSQENYGINVAWKSNWNEKNTFYLSANNSIYNLDSENQSVQNNQKLNQRNSVNDIGLSLKNECKIGEGVNFNCGYQYRQVGVLNFDEIDTPSFSRTVKNVLDIHSAILESTYNSKYKRVFAKAGLRTNYIEKFQKLVYEPRFQVNYTFNNVFKIGVLGEMKSQTLSQVIDLQADFLGIEKRRWTVADNAVYPIIKSKQVDVEFTYNDKKWLLSLVPYYKNINGITSRSQSFQNQLENINVKGNYTTYGVEFLAQRSFKNWNAYLSYNWNSNQYDFEGFTPSKFDNNFRISNALNCATIYNYANIKMALGAKWFSGKPYTGLKSNTVSTGNPLEPILYDDPNNKQLEYYFQINASASYVWKIGKESTLQLSAAVLNLFDKNNTINRFYGQNENNQTINTFNTFSLNRTPNLNLKMTF
jgi:hypothetical protein